MLLASGILALLGIIAGVATLIYSLSRPTTFGWFAYAPLSEETFLPGMAILSNTQVTGLALLAAGLLCAAFWAGLRVGRRSR
jgi:heme/copper-type cytochrome/quinol oxidase subunit 1